MALHRILCVDDDPDTRTLLDIGLSTVAGFELLVCRSAREAFAAIGDFAPDLVIIDGMMPETDGPKAMHTLCEHDGGRHCPVVFLTAASQPEDIRRLAATGAIAVITKPFDPMTLGNEIHAAHAKWSGS